MKMTITLTHLYQNKEWPHFAWNVVINGESFSYKTGIGHAYLGKKQKPEDVPVNEYRGFLKLRDDSRSLGVVNAYAKAPSQDEVLHALLSDAECGNYSFDEFCDNLGYSNDSLKALDVYRACGEIAKKLRGCLKGDYQATKERIQALEL